jgi:hypothetical protein
MHRAGADGRGLTAASPPAQDPRHLSDGASIESRLGGGDLLGLQDVELHDVLRRLELAHAQELPGRLRIAEVVRERELVEQRSEIGALQHLEVGGGELHFAEIGDVVRRELLQERRVVALDLARQHHEHRPFLVGVGVDDRLVDRLVGGGIGLLRRRTPRRRRGIAEFRLGDCERSAGEHRHPEQDWDELLQRVRAHNPSPSSPHRLCKESTHFGVGFGPSPAFRQ